MNVGWKINDATLIFSGNLLYSLLPFMPACPRYYFPCYCYCLYFLSGFSLFMYIMFVFFMSPVWPAQFIFSFYHNHNSIVRRVNIATMNCQFLCCFTCLNTPQPSVLRHRFIIFIKRVATPRTYLWYESTNVGLLILVLNPRCGKFITSAASGLLMHVTV